MLLKQPYLAKVDRCSSKEKKGIIYSEFGRPIICLPTRKLEMSDFFAVLYIVDTASPSTYLSTETWKKIAGVSDLKNL
jgi:hypothetical protein